MLHFPIALLVLAGAMELRRLFRERPSLGLFVVWLLGRGAVGAIAASATGWVFARAWIDFPSTARRWVRRGVIGLTTVILAVTAHLGALMVWGGDSFS